MLCAYHRKSVGQLGPASILWVPWGTFLVHVTKRTFIASAVFVFSLPCSICTVCRGLWGTLQGMFLHRVGLGGCLPRIPLWSLTQTCRVPVCENQRHSAHLVTQLFAKRNYQQVALLNAGVPVSRDLHEQSE